MVGTHFFSPANVMKLLENVRGRHTSAQTIATVMALGNLQNRGAPDRLFTPISVALA